MYKSAEQSPELVLMNLMREQEATALLELRLCSVDCHVLHSMVPQDSVE